MTVRDAGNDGRFCKGPLIAIVFGRGLLKEYHMVVCCVDCQKGLYGICLNKI